MPIILHKYIALPSPQYCCVGYVTRWIQETLSPNTPLVLSHQQIQARYNQHFNRHHNNFLPNTIAQHTSFERCYYTILLKTNFSNEVLKKTLEGFPSKIIYRINVIDSQDPHCFGLYYDTNGKRWIVFEPRMLFQEYLSQIPQKKLSRFELTTNSTDDLIIHIKENFNDTPLEIIGYKLKYPSHPHKKRRL